jgi:hypothetical protein
MSESLHRKLVSEKQLAANRANAAKSTGPKSPEGRGHSSRNAVKHGLASENYTVVRLEDIDEVASLRAGLIATYQPVNSQELYALDQIAIRQQAMLRAARFEAGLFSACLNESLGPDGSPTFPLNEDVTYGIEITQAQNRNYCLADGFLRLARQGNGIQLFLRYQAQAERLYRRAVEDFERVRKLRAELPIEPILEDDPPAEPEENTTDSSSSEPAPSEPIPGGAGASACQLPSCEIDAPAPDPEPLIPDLPRPSGCSARASKDQLQTELQLAHVDTRAKAADGAKTACSWYRHARSVGSVAGERSVRIAKVGVVGEIESFEAELHVTALSEVEVLQGRKIPRADSGARDHVAAHIAPLVELVQGERLDIEPFASRGITEIDALAWNRIRAVASGVGAIRTRADSGREAAAKSQDRTHAPAADDGIRDAAMVEEMPASADWQVIKNGCDEALRLVKGRPPSLAGIDAGIVLLAVVVGHGADAAAIIQ